MELKELEKILKGKRVEIFEIYFTFIDEGQDVSWKIEVGQDSLSVLFNGYDHFQLDDLSFPLVFNDLELIDNSWENALYRYEIRSEEKNFGFSFCDFMIDPNGGCFMP